MRNNYLTDAINIKSYNLSESDKIVLMYSRERGLLKGVAKGSKKLKSKLGGRMDALIANKLMLFKGKNLDTICQAEALNTFNSLREDMNKMLYAMYMSEIVSNFGTEDDPNSAEIYDTFYKALSKISKSKTIVEILLCTMRFQLKMMKFCGYELELNNCVRCGAPIATQKSENTQTEVIFAPEKGGVFCIKCAQSGIRFPEKLRAFLAALAETDFEEKTIYDEKATEKVAQYCFSILRKYTAEHCAKNFKTTKMLAQYSI